MIFELEGVRVARGVRYRPATRAELYVQARQLGLPGCSRMRKHELARAVARARRRPPASWATARCREERSRVAAVTSERVTAIPAFLRRLSATGGTDRGTVAVLVAALGRLRWTERIALPLAAVVLAGGVGASMPVLIAGGTPEGVAALKVVAPIPASQASPDLIRPVEPPQKSARPAGGGASQTGTRSTAVVAAQEGGSSAVDQPAEVQARSSGGGAPEPSASPAPQAPAGAEQEGGAPTPEPAPGPTPAPPGDEEPEPTGEKATLCHKSGSKSSKTIVVGEDAVEEHLAHGDTLGACP
jgi:hypothetical protein